jgi:hypothetical protein
MEVPVQPLAPDQCLAFFPGDERVAGGGSNRWQSEPVGDFAFEQAPIGSMIGARYRRPTRLGEDRCESDDGLVVDQGRMGVSVGCARAAGVEPGVNPISLPLDELLLVPPAVDDVRGPVNGVAAGFGAVSADEAVVASLCGDDLRQGGQVVLSVAGSVSPLSQRRCRRQTR